MKPAGQRQPEIIAVSSGKGGTGKTLITISLGFALRYAGHEVLLVDSDTGTDGLSLFLLGKEGHKYVRDYPHHQTFSGLIGALAADGSAQYEARQIFRDEISRLPRPEGRARKSKPTPDDEEEIGYPALISTRNIYGDEALPATAAPDIDRDMYRAAVGALFDQIRQRAEFDYVLVDTRGGFAYESADICALADSFLIVTEPDRTSLFQDRNLVRHIAAAAKVLDHKPLLRAVIVNKASRGEEEDFRSILDRDLPVSYSETYPVPLDIEAVRANRNHNLPYLSAPSCPYAQATLRAFAEILNLVTAEWGKTERSRWRRLAERVGSAAERAQAERKRRARWGAVLHAGGGVVLAGVLAGLIWWGLSAGDAARDAQDARRLAEEKLALSARYVDQLRGLLAKASSGAGSDWRLALLRSKDTPPAERERYLRDLVAGGKRAFAAIDLSELDLTGLDLRRADLTRANLQGAVLVGARLSGAVLAGADLSGAKLTLADLSDAVLAEAKLAGADARWADLSGARDLKVDQLAQAESLYQADMDRSLTTALEKRKPSLFRPPAEKGRAPEFVVSAALKAVRAGRAQQTLGWLSRVARVFPDDAAVLHAAGVALWRARRLFEADDVLSRAIQMNPREPRYLLDRARVRLLAKRPDEAAEDCSAALKLARTAEAHLARALSHAMMGDEKAAQADITAALKIRPTPESRAEAAENLALLYVGRGRWKEALAQAEAAARLAENSERAWLIRAAAAQQLGDAKAAGLAAEKWSQLQKDRDLPEQETSLLLLNLIGAKEARRLLPPAAWGTTEATAKDGPSRARKAI